MTRFLHQTAEVLEQINWDQIPTPVLVSLVAPALPWVLRVTAHRFH